MLAGLSWCGLDTDSPGSGGRLLESHVHREHRRSEHGMHIIASCATRVCNPTEPQWTSARPTTVLRRGLFLITQQCGGLFEPHPRPLRLCNAAQESSLAAPEFDERSRRSRLSAVLQVNRARPTSPGRRDCNATTLPARRARHGPARGRPARRCGTRTVAREPAQFGCTALGRDTGTGGARCRRLGRANRPPARPEAIFKQRIARGHRSETALQAPLLLLRLDA